MNNDLPAKVQGRPSAVRPQASREDERNPEAKLVKSERNAESGGLSASLSAIDSIDQ